MRSKLMTCCVGLGICLCSAARADVPATPDPVPAAKDSASLVSLSPKSLAPNKTHTPALLPANLVYVQLSREHLRKHLDRDFTSNDPVHDEILGTDLTGDAVTAGLTDLVLVEDAKRASAFIVCKGAIDSRTIGRKGQVTLHNETHTDFVARKQLILDETGLHSLPATVQARTTSETKDIETGLSGPKGRILTRVAWQRVAKTRSEVEEIASRHAEVSLAKELDRRVEKSLADLERIMSVKPPQLAGRDAQPPRIQFRSTPTHVHAVVFRADATPAERELAPPTVSEDCGLAVRVHRTVVLRAMTEPDAMGPLVSQMIRPSGPQQLTAGKPGGKAKAYHSTWSPNREWLIVTSVEPVVEPVADPMAAN